jgi:hypothetical protein
MPLPSGLKERIGFFGEIIINALRQAFSGLK